jgi:hypothetical protein
MKKLIILLILMAGTVLASVTDTTTKYQYFQPDGSVTTFTFTMPCNSSSDIKVERVLTSTGVPETLVEDTDYTIAATNSDYVNGGVVTIDPALAATYDLTITRDIVGTQETVSGAVNAISIEAMVDKSTRQYQDNRNKINQKALRIPDSDPTTAYAELENYIDRAGKVLGFDDTTGAPVAVEELPATSAAVSTYMKTVMDDASAVLAMATLNGWPIINATNSAYGATAVAGDDDTAAIEAAIAAISGSGIVYLPEGVYGVSTTIAVPTGVYLLGAGAHYSTDAIGTRIVSTVDAAACFKFGDGSTLVHSAGIKNMRITASGTGIDGIGVHFSYTRWCRIENVSVFDFSTGEGIRIEGQTASTLPSAQNTVSNVYLANNLVNLFLTGQNANDTSACDESNFTNIRIQPTGLTNSIGIRLRKGLNNTFRNVVISDSSGTTSGTVGIDLVNGGATDDVYCTRGNSFFNVSLELLATGIAIGTLPHSNSFYDTRIHCEGTYATISDSSGGGNRFIGLTGGENITNARWQWPQPSNPQNLLVNGEMERWEAGASSAPTGWTLTGYSGETVARETTTSHKGTYSCKLLSGTANAEVYQDVTPYSHLAGRYVAMSAWVYASYTESATALVRIHISDDSGTEAHSYSKAHSGTAGWELLSCRKKIVSGTTQVRANFSINGVITNAYIDQVTLVEGLEVPLPGSTPATYANFDDIIPAQIVVFEGDIVTFENEMVTFKE